MKRNQSVSGPDKDLSLLREEIAALIVSLESLYGRKELYGEHPLKDVYLSARAAAYQMKHAPELFGKIVFNLSRNNTQTK
jgi:hypothetical protein